MILDLFGCMFGKHRRGRRSHVWHDGSVYRSACRGCGRPMLRDRSGWRLARPEEAGTGPGEAGPA